LLFETWAGKFTGPEFLGMENFAKPWTFADPLGTPRGLKDPQAAVAMLEAAVAGVPTVGTAVGHIREWSPAAAACAPVGDWARLSKIISQLIEDDDLRLRIAREARQRAVREDANYTAECFQTLYATCSRPRPPPA